MSRELDEIRSGLAAQEKQQARGRTLATALKPLRRRLPMLTAGERQKVLQNLIPRLTETGHRVEIDVCLRVAKYPNRLAEICGEYLGQSRVVLPLCARKPSIHKQFSPASRRG